MPPSVRLCLAAGVLLLVTEALGDELPSSPKVVISGPETAAPGELVKLRGQLVYQREWLRVEQENAVPVPTFLWDLANPPAGYVINAWTFENGRTCVFATSVPGVYRFFLAGTQLGPDGQPRLFIARHTLRVGPPGPEPQPPVPPPPHLPEGQFGLAPQVYRLLQQHVPAEQRGLAHALAENYRSVAAQIAAGTLLQPEQILNATAQDNRRIVADQRAAWEPFFAQLAVIMQELDRSDRLKTANDFQIAWTEIATGLEAVR